MKKFYIKFIILALGVYLFAFFSPFSVLASEIIFQSPNKTLGVGDEFSVPVVLSSKGVSVNTIAGDITWSNDTLSAVNILSANSIVGPWIEMPHISGNTISFSGIMPGGYETLDNTDSQKSGPGLIATIIFRVIKEGEGKIEFSDMHLFKNDGLGTEISVQNNPLVLSFSQHGSGLNVPINSNIPPEAFIPIIVHNSDIYNGQTVVIFSTTDKENGIDHYEVKQGDNGKWITAASPFLLPNQWFSGTVFVKAFDLAGNYTIATVEMKQKISIWFIFSLLIIVVIVFFILFVLLKYYKNKKDLLGGSKLK
jgi:hypothetical protein